MKIAYGAILGIMAFFNNYSTNQALAEQVREYEKMLDLYLRAKELLTLKDDNASFFKEVIFELSCEALRENGNWLLIKRQRPLTLPK